MVRVRISLYCYKCLKTRKKNKKKTKKKKTKDRYHVVGNRCDDCAATAFFFFYDDLVTKIVQPSFDVKIDA